MFYFDFFVQVRICDALDVFAKLTEQIIDGQLVIQKGDQFTVESNLVEDFQLLLQLSLHMIHLISQLPQSDEESFNFKRIVHQLCPPIQGAKKGRVCYICRWIRKFL